MTGEYSPPIIQDMSISTEAGNVLKTIEKYQPVRPSLLVEKLELSEKTLYKHLSTLLDENLIVKRGTNGKSYYYVNDKVSDNDYISVDPLDTIDLLIEQNYIYVNPSGVIKRGLKGFNEWCEKNKLNFDLQKKLYSKKLKDISKIKKFGLIFAKNRILSGNEKVILDEVLFSDFYTFDHFGKTKLGQLIYIAKTSQNVELIREISLIIKPSIIQLIKKYNIEMVCFIPPTIDRKIQIMDELEKSLNLSIPKLKIEKVASQTKVAQKTLRKLEDRIINAKNTIALNPNQKIIGNVLIIDDATGSGATLNETAKKIRNISENKIKIYGYSVVGSYKGFDVISEI